MEEEKGGSTESNKNIIQSLGVMAGCVFVLLGSLLHSLMFVLSDFSMNNLHLNYEEVSLGKKETISIDISYKQTKGAVDNSIPGEIWSCCLGSIESCFMIAWVMIGVGIHGFTDKGDSDSSEVTDEKSFRGYHASSLVGILGLIFIDAVHASTFFSLLQNMGAVAAALLKGVQAVAVIGLSALLYCPTEETECLTWRKTMSAILVVTGVVGYGFGSKR